MIFSVVFVLVVFIGVATYASTTHIADPSQGARLEKLVSICEHGIWLMCGALAGICGGKIAH
jgi:hypothetical protein